MVGKKVVDIMVDMYDDLNFGLVFCYVVLLVDGVLVLFVVYGLLLLNIVFVCVVMECLLYVCSMFVELMFDVLMVLL